MRKLNNILLNNQWIKEKIKRKIRKYFEMNENNRNLCSRAKAGLNWEICSCKCPLRKKKDLKSIT